MQNDTDRFRLWRVADEEAVVSEQSWNLEVELTGGQQKGSWTYAVLPGSAAVLGTRAPKKVTATVDGVAVAVTLMPMGDGTHMFPIKAATRKATGKGIGDVVALRIDQ